MIGRASELAAAMEVVDRARAGAGGGLAIVGEPGVGKSTLLREVESRAGSSVRVLRVRGVASEAVLPFAGLHQLVFPIRDLVDHLPAPQARALRGAMGIEATAASDPYLLAIATLSIVSEAAGTAGAAVLVDDFPWVDAASRDALLFTARRLATERVALIVTSRSDDWTAVGDDRLPLLEIEGFRGGDAAALIETSRGVPVQDDVARRLVDATHGNPLALIEVASRLSGHQLRGQAPLPPRLPVTGNLERAFAARLDSLPADLQASLVLVAADDSGRRDVLLRAGATLDLRASFIEDGCREGFLVALDRIEFRHPLIRSAVYGRADAAQRQRAHLALADALEAIDPDRALWHRVAGAHPPDPVLAARLAALATRARARGAPEEAAAAWERAALFTGSHAESVPLLLAAADAARAAGHLGAARESLLRVERGPLEPPQTTEATRLRGAIELAAGDALRAYRALLQAARSAADSDPERALEILNLAAEAASLSGERGTSAELLAVVGEIRDMPGDRARFLRAALIGFAADFAGDMPVAIAHLRAAVGLARGVADPVVKMIGGRAAIYIGDDIAARDLHLAVVEDGRERASVDLLPIAAPRLALAEALLGRWASADVTAAETARIADETGQVLLAPHGRLCLALVAAMRGDHEASERHLGDALEPVRGRAVGLLEDEARWVRGVVALGRRESEEALVHLRAIDHPVIEALAGLDRLEAAAAASDRDRCSTWLSHVAEFARHSDARWALARHAYGEALLATDPTEAEHRFDAAAALAATSTRPFERARIELAAGSFLRRRRRRVDARAHLRAAAATFDALGAGPWAERARLEMRATGEHVAPPEARATDRLTPQELQVARSVAEGHSTRDVAARLFLSPRTVEFHLRNIFAKLGITSRTQLARVALEDAQTSRVSPAP